MTDNVARILPVTAGNDPTRPLLTWYDDATGERTELSGATLDNWVAKTANLLIDAAALGPGDPVGMLLPPHWQTAAVLLGTLAAGGRPHWGEPQPVEVLFAAADRIEQAADWPAGERYALALAPLAAPLRTVPPGFADYVVDVRGHSDHFQPATAPHRDPIVRELIETATARAGGLGIAAGDRVLIDAAHHVDPVEWLLAPLAVGASVVLCAHLDHGRLADRLATERVTVTLAG